MSAPVIDVAHLVKRYGETTAVGGISFAVEHGVTAALLGGNGAGKTTTLSILLGLLLPSAGTVRILGEDMLRHR
ncbi:MAG TPA: ATP-binding cassette domain-containing protein, partial [Stellaceae bacterium]|nr:ATP-binding cassette domain-containing protein [Stellaceae bacterium]